MRKEPTIKELRSIERENKKDKEPRADEKNQNIIDWLMSLPC